VARLGQPVVGSKSQTADALSNARAAGTDDNAEARHRFAKPLKIFPSLRPKDREVDHDRTEAHCYDLINRRRASQRAVLPAEPIKTLIKHLKEAGVVVNYSDPQSQ
jgi:hypothetical protein